MQLVTILSLFTGIVALFGVTFFVFSLRQRRRFEAFKNDVEKQLRMANSSVVVMGNRLLDFESRLANICKDQQVLSDTQQDFSYTKARTLIEQNVALDAVVASTGLSRSEVDLIQLIHAQKRPMPEHV